MRLLLAMTLLLCACTRERAAAPGAPAIEAQGAAARVLPNGVGAVYLRLLNHAAQEDALLSVSSPLARAAELHEVVEEGELLRMVPRPEGFVLPAGGTLALLPGGRHVMLYGVTLPADATALPLTLHLRRAGSVSVLVPLRAPELEVGEEQP
jgi:copper(I)-binding protein